MALILSIDAATEKASVCLSDDEKIIGYCENEYQKEHASFIHKAIKKLLSNTNITLQNIDAFAVTSGPGSYTGIRVAMAAAKGFCFVLSKPLITVNTLTVMALAAKKINPNQQNVLFCPMIDARRMEVFTALFDNNINMIIKPKAIVLSELFLKDEINENKVIFFGNGSSKFQPMMTHANASFLDVVFDAKNLAELSLIEYANSCFSNIIYSEPNYFKDFFLT